MGAGNHHPEDTRHVVRGEVGVPAEVGEDPDVQTEDGAIRLHRGPDLDDILAGVERGEEIFAAGLHPAPPAAPPPPSRGRGPLLPAEPGLLYSDAAHRPPGDPDCRLPRSPS